jgi:CMP-N-acetylneuraminic acid synthetase
MDIAVIPARGGSKRIPRKNIRYFAGRPMIAHAIAAATSSALIDHVVVSTDDDEIAQIAREWGADTPFARPSALADGSHAHRACRRPRHPDMQDAGLVNRNGLLHLPSGALYRD